MAEWPRMVALEGSGCPPPYTGRQAETRSRFQRLLRARVARDGLRSHPGDRGGSARGMERGRSPPRAPVAGTEDSTLASCVSSGVVCRGFLLVFFFAGLTEGPPSVPPPGICGPCPDAPAMGPLSRPRVECPGWPTFHGAPTKRTERGSERDPIWVPGNVSGRRGNPGALARVGSGCAEPRPLGVRRTPFGRMPNPVSARPLPARDPGPLSGRSHLSTAAKVPGQRRGSREAARERSDPLCPPSGTAHARAPVSHPRRRDH